MTSVKTCRKCGNEYPATNEFFVRDKRNSDGLDSYCKGCERERSRQFRRENPEKARGYSRKYYETHRGAVLESCRNYYTANTERVIERTNRYRQDNPEKRKEWARRQYFANRDKNKEINRRYRQLNPDKERERKRIYAAKNPDKGVLYARRREARKRGLPDTLTDVQWVRAIQYWQSCCAYCGSRMDNPTMDHYVALTHPRCLRTVVENIIPACLSCNLSKHNKEATVWLTEKFGEDRAREILARIHAYFEAIRAEEGKD